MKRNLVVSLLLLVVLLAGTVACSQPSPATTPAAPATSAAKPTQAATTAAPKAITLTFADASPAETHSRSDLMSQYFRDIETASKGAIKVQEYWAGSLGGSNTALESVQNGVYDIGTVMKNQYLKQLPEWQFSDLVFMVPTADIVAGLKALRETEAKYNMGKMLETRFNQKTLWTVMSTDYGMSANRAITKFTDLKGMKIRASGAYGDTAKAAGATLITLGSEEVYDALQKGIIDGVANSIEIMYRYKRHEAAKFYSALHMGCLMNMRININQATWNKLPADVQKIMLDVGQKAELAAAKTLVDWEWQYSGIPMEKAGVKFNDLDAVELAKFQATAGPIWDKWVTANEKPDFPAKQVMADYRAALEKFKKQ